MGAFDFLKKLKKCDSHVIEELLEQKAEGGRETVEIAIEIHGHLTEIRKLMQKLSDADKMPCFFATIDSMISPCSIDNKIKLMEAFVSGLKFMKEQGVED